MFAINAHTYGACVLSEEISEAHDDADRHSRYLEQLLAGGLESRAVRVHGHRGNVVLHAYRALTLEVRTLFGRHIDGHHEQQN